MFRPDCQALVYIGLGDGDQAFAWLEKVVADRSEWVLHRFRVDPVLDPLRSDPRFDVLIQRMNLEARRRWTDRGRITVVFRGRKLSRRPWKVSSVVNRRKVFLMLTIPLTASQELALRRLVGILDGAGACYQFTGGFAGNLHGSRWPLHDLDVDVAREDLPQVAELLGPVYHSAVGLYVDDEFELKLLRAEAEGVEIDVSQAEEAYARVGGRRVPLGTSLLHRRRVRVVGHGGLGAAVGRADCPARSCSAGWPIWPTCGPSEARAAVAAPVTAAD